MAKVTIIIPNYNHADYIIQRLESIRQQTYTDWEAIIIDDASTDQSVDMISEYMATHTFKVKTFIKHKVNSGSGYLSWQKGIALAETPFIWIAETDDYSEPTFLEETVKALEEYQNVSLAFTASNYVNELGELLYTTDKRFTILDIKKDAVQSFEGHVITSHLPLQSLITNGSAAVFRKPTEPLPDAIFSNKQTSDLFLWQHLLNGSGFVCINKTLNNFRRHEASTTTQNFKSGNASVYTEYCKFANYFDSDNRIKKEVAKHYTRHFLIANQRHVGAFYLSPLKDLKLSKFTKFAIVIRTYLNRIFKTR